MPSLDTLPLQALGRCAKSTELDFEEAVRRALSGECPGQNPPPIRISSSAANSNTGVVREECIPGSAEAKSGEADDGGDGVQRGQEGISRGESNAVDEKVRKQRLIR